MSDSAKPEYPWHQHDKYPEHTVTCRCGEVYRSHSHYSIETRGLVARKPCPKCKRTDNLRKASSEPETHTIG